MLAGCSRVQLHLSRVFNKSSPNEEPALDEHIYSWHTGDSTSSIQTVLHFLRWNFTIDVLISLSLDLGLLWRCCLSGLLGFRVVDGIISLALLSCVSNGCSLAVG